MIVTGLYLTMAKLPHVGALMERLEGQRQATFFAELETDRIEGEARHRAVRAERLRIETAINARYPRKPNETETDYLATQIARSKALADYYQLAGDTERAAFFAKDSAGYQRQLDELAPEELSERAAG